MSRLDVRWERFFALNGLFFAVLCGLGLEVICPQPPHYDWSASRTVEYYVDNRTGILWEVTLCGISMAFLLGWTIQLGVMLWREHELSRAAVLVGIVSLATTPILLAFDEVFFAMATFRAGHINAGITQTMSDIAWIGSMIVWPPLCFAMAIIGVLILQRHATPLFPRWLGWFSLFCAAVEPFQLGIVFTNHGPFGPRGWTTWYGAVATWGVWIVAITVIMCRRTFATATSEPQAATTKPLVGMNGAR